MLTFPPLAYSQIRLFADSPWFLLYGPFMALGTPTFFVSLLADGIGRGFDLDEHRKIVASWLPLWYPSVATAGRTSQRCAPPTTASSRRTCSTTAPGQK